MNHEPHVLIVGGGPAGLAAAAVLRHRGIGDVLVVDREVEAGGMPRFCPHPTFGLTDFYRPMSGPAYAAKLRAQVDPRWMATATTVTAIGPDLETVISSQRGETVLKPRRILLATGIRETPRSARLISGDRPRNVLTTGALQRVLHEGNRLPFRNPVVVGTELVSFSALLSLRDAGVRATAMIEAGSRIVARKPADLLARTLLRTPILFRTRVLGINAAPENAGELASITVEDQSGAQRQIDCDAVIFTGAFAPEASLLSPRFHLLDRVSRGPAIDQCWRLAEPGLYAAGNVLRSVETAAWSAREGALAAEAIAADHFRGRDGRRVAIVAEDPVAFSTPSAITVPGNSLGALGLTVRMARPARGRFTLATDGEIFWRSARMAALPERRIHLSRTFPDLANVHEIRIGFEADGTA